MKPDHDRIARLRTFAVALFLAAALLAACGGGDDKPLIIGGEEVTVAEARAMVEKAIEENGYDEQCRDFPSMTAEQRTVALAGLVAVGLVSDDEMAVRFMAIAQDVCSEHPRIRP